jgi:hypothetical protein
LKEKSFQFNVFNKIKNFIYLRKSIIYFLAVSYNQPKFCPNATWNENAVTFADQSTVGTEPYGIFVNTNNTVYVADNTGKRVQVWREGSNIPITANFIGLFSLYSLFVTITGDIYVDNGGIGRIEKLTLNAIQSSTVMNVDGQCYGLFVDINDNLYCSMSGENQVIKKALDSPTITIVAGTGSYGSLSNMLNGPRGIFVDINFDLYVADFNNDRIQLFKLGELNATTLVGTGASSDITLNQPSGIVLDADKYLFIVDRSNRRIVGQGPNGFRCLVGCSGSGSASNELDGPITLSFDSYGNMFVTDSRNNRIQKFDLSMNSCSKCLKIFDKKPLILKYFQVNSFLEIESN